MEGIVAKDCNGGGDDGREAKVIHLSWPESAGVRRMTGQFDAASRGKCGDEGGRGGDDGGGGGGGGGGC